MHLDLLLVRLPARGVVSGRLHGCHKVDLGHEDKILCIMSRCMQAGSRPLMKQNRLEIELRLEFCYGVFYDIQSVVGPANREI